LQTKLELLKNFALHQALAFSNRRENPEKYGFCGDPSISRGFIFKFLWTMAFYRQNYIYHNRPAQTLPSPNASCYRFSTLASFCWTAGQLDGPNPQNP
jgi:hypothetical protein